MQMKALPDTPQGRRDASTIMDECIASISKTLSMSPDQVASIIDQEAGLLIIKIKTMYDDAILNVMNKATSILDYADLYEKVPTPWLERDWSKRLWSILDMEYHSQSPFANKKLMESYHAFESMMEEDMTIYLDLKTKTYHLNDHLDEKGQVNLNLSPKQHNPQRYMVLYVK